MKSIRYDHKRKLLQFLNRRRGSVLVLAAACIVGVFAFAAFTVDVGYISLTKSQMQSAADASALGSGLELLEGLGPYAQYSTEEVDEMARAAAVAVAAANRAGDRECFAAPDRDVRFGQVRWNSATGQFDKTWDVAPYNLVEVSLRRDKVASEDGMEVTTGDSPLNLFFAPVIGHSTAKLSVKATAGLIPGVGFRIPGGSTLKAGVLPITYDIDSWNNVILAGLGNDDYAYNPDNKNVTRGADGICDFNLYPQGSSDLPPGSRGTLDLGLANNSTSDLDRQILDGLNSTDLSVFPSGELRTDAGALTISGDTGISAGLKEELASIIGQTRALPLFSSVSGPGENANYTIVKFVGVRVMGVKLVGSNKHVMVQPAVLSDVTVIRGDMTVEESSIFSPVILMQ